MKYILLLVLCLVTFAGFAQSEKELLSQAVKHETALNESGAFEALKKVIQINPKNYFAHWKLSELASRVGNRQETPKAKQDFFNAGKSYATTAIKLNPNGADGYYAMAVAMGRLALSQSGRERVNSVKEIKAHLDKALKLNPYHPRAWHVLGKWHFEVSNLNMLEKALLKMVYGGLPPASLSESIRCYEKAKSLDANFLLNYYELAKAYKRNDEDKKAIELLKKLSLLPNRTQDDTTIKAKGAALLKELGS